MTLQIVPQNPQEQPRGWGSDERLASLMPNAALPDITRRRLTQIDVTLTDPQALFFKAIELRNAGAHQESFELFNSATKLEWSFIEAHIECGNAASSLKLYYVALESYRNALELNPSCTIAHYNTALTYIDLNEREEAITLLTQLIKLDPAFRPAYITLAKLLSLKRQDRVAIKLLMRAARLHPRSAESLVFAGVLYQRNTQTPSAIRCYERALKIDPWHPAAFYHLGVTCFRIGDFPRAVRYLGEAVNGDRGNKLAVALLKSASNVLRPKTQTTRPSQTGLFEVDINDQKSISSPTTKRRRTAAKQNRAPSNK